MVMCHLPTPPSEYDLRFTCGVLLFDEDGNILVVLEGSGRYGLPKGKIEAQDVIAALGRGSSHPSLQLCLALLHANVLHTLHPELFNEICKCAAIREVQEEIGLRYGHDYTIVSPTPLPRHLVGEHHKAVSIFVGRMLRATAECVVDPKEIQKVLWVNWHSDTLRHLNQSLYMLKSKKRKSTTGPQVDLFQTAKRMAFPGV